MPARPRESASVCDHGVTLVVGAVRGETHAARLRAGRRGRGRSYGGACPRPGSSTSRRPVTACKATPLWSWRHSSRISSSENRRHRARKDGLGSASLEWGVSVYLGPGPSVEACGLRAPCQDTDTVMGNPNPAARGERLHLTAASCLIPSSVARRRACPLWTFLVQELDMRTAAVLLTSHLKANRRRLVATTSRNRDGENHGGGVLGRFLVLHPYLFVDDLHGNGGYPTVLLVGLTSYDSLGIQVEAPRKSARHD